MRNQAMHVDHLRACAVGEARYLNTAAAASPVTQGTDDPTPGS
jgi:hypothetical protein